MGIVLKYIQRNPKAGLLYFRRQFPANLRRYIPAQPRHLRRSLKANAIDAPGALDRYKAAHDEYERLVASARKVQTGTYDTLDGPMIAYLAAKFESEWRTKADEIRWQDGEAKSRQDAGVEHMLNDFQHWNADGDLEQIVPYWTKDATSLITAEGLVLDPHKTDLFERLCGALNEAAISVCEAIRLGRQNQQKELPDQPRRNDPTSSGKTSIKSFEALAVETMDLPQAAISKSHRTEINSALRFFKEAFGEPTPSEIDKAMVTEWITLLSKRPSKLPKEQRSIPIRKLVELYEGCDDIPRLTRQTYRGRLIYMAARWDAIAAAGWMEEGKSNPFRGHKIIGNTTSRMIEGLSCQELHSIFALPIFTEGERPAGGKGEASYWMPLIMLMTGSRPEEAAQLLTSNIRKENGVWFIEYTSEGMHPEIGQKRLKTDRTKSGYRIFPIHQRLLDLNLLGYIAHLNTAGHEALFPMLRPKSKDGNDLHAGFGLWWGEYLRKHNILPPSSEVTRQPSKGFRHVWTTASREAGVPWEAASYIQGHKVDTGNSHDRYGLKHSWGEFSLIVNPQGPDWTKVIPWAAPA